MKLKKASLLTITGYLFTALVGVFFIFQAINFAPHDFANYYFGAYFLKTGELTADLYFPFQFNKLITELGYDNIFLSYAPNTPFLAILFYPLTFLKLATAKIVFNFLSLGLFLISLKKLITVYPVKPIYFFLIPLIFLIPLRNNFLFGQVYLLLFFLLTEGFLAYKNKDYLKMGIFWGIAILFKVFPVFLFGMLLFKKQKKAFIYLSISCILLLGFSLVINGFEIWEFYFKSVLPKSGNGEISGEFVQNYQSMFMFLKYAFPNNSIAFSLFLLIFKLLLIIGSYYITKNETSQLKVFSFWMLICILYSPYGSTYSSLLLIFALVYFINKKGNYYNYLALLLLIGISNIPVSYFSNYNIPFSFPRLWLMLVFFILIIKENFSQINFKRGFTFIIPILGIYFLFLIQKKEPITIKNLSKDHILTYDFEIQENSLIYKYWNNQGVNVQRLDLQIKKVDSVNVRLKNNQIYYQNKQLTFDNDHKLKPIIINDNTLVYLSDYKKGIGFYSLYITQLNEK